MSDRGDAVAEAGYGDLVATLDEASLSRVHLRAVLASGVGFFTDAYDLFVIGIASTLITKDWHLSSGHLAILNSTMLGAAFLGALVFGRYADVVGRKRVYWLVAAIMIAGALGSAFSQSFWMLIAFRFVLGFVGIDGLEGAIDAREGVVEELPVAFLVHHVRSPQRRVKAIQKSKPPRRTSMGTASPNL